MKQSEVLRKAKALIDRPEKWFGPPEKRDGSNCAGTAIISAGEFSGWDNPVQFLFEKANNIPNEHIALWNNTPNRTHAEVMQAFDRAIALAEQEEPGESDSDWAKRKVAEVTRVKEAA